MNNIVAINLVQDYTHRKLADIQFVQELIKKLEGENKLANYKHIVLDICGCRVGYPATPQLIDYFLNHLLKQNGEKTLTVKMNAIANVEWIFLNLLVLEGEFFAINDKINSEEDLTKSKQLMNEKLKQTNIAFNVIVSNGEEYKYGNQK